MNEEPAPASEREPRWTDGIWICHPTYLRILTRLIATGTAWLATRIVAGGEHFCQLGYKRAEAIAPYIIATLAALCVLLSRKYRWGFLRAVALVLFYAYAIYSPYVEWVHGAGRSNFPNYDPPDFSYEDVPVELPPKTK